MTLPKRATYAVAAPPLHSTLRGAIKRLRSPRAAAAAVTRVRAQPAVAAALRLFAGVAARFPAPAAAAHPGAGGRGAPQYPHAAAAAAAPSGGAETPAGGRLRRALEATPPDARTRAEKALIARLQVRAHGGRHSRVGAWR